MTTKSQTSKRGYRRRSEEERIRDLEQRIADLKAKQAKRERKDDPLVREIPKMQKRLRSFAQLAMDSRRPDIANSATAFASSLERILRSELQSNAQAQRTPPIEDADAE